MTLAHNIVARLSLDSTQFDGAAKRSGQSMRGMMAESVSLQKTVVGLGAAYFAAKGIIAGLSTVTRAAMEAQQAQIFFERSLGQLAGTANATAAALSKTYGTSVTAMKQAIAEGNALGRTMGLDRNQSLALANSMAELTVKFADFYGLDHEEAFRLIEAGVSAGGKSLRRYGIDLDAAATKTWALEHGWIKQGEALNDVGEALVRFRIEQEKINNMIDSAPEGVTSLRQQWERFTANLKDDTVPILVAMGEVLAKNMELLNQTHDRLRQATVSANLGSAIVEPSSTPGMRSEGRGIDWVALYEARKNADLPVYQIPPTVGSDALGPMLPYGSATKVSSHLTVHEPPPPGITKATEEAKTAAQTTLDIARAYEQMYRDIDEKSAQSYAARRTILLMEYQEYASVIKDKELLNQWYERQMEKLQREETEAGNDFLAGFVSRTEKMKEELWTLGRAGAETAQMLRDGFADAWTDALFEGKNFGEQMKAMLKDIAKENFRQMIARPMASQSINWAGIIGQGIASWVGGWGGGTAQGPANMPAGGTPAVNPHVGHSGGRIGMGAFPVRHEPLALWSGAPRLHDGLRPDEFRFIGQRGEKITSKSGVAAENRLMGRMVSLLEAIANKDNAVNVAVVRSREDILDTLRSRDGRRAIAEANG